MSTPIYTNEVIAGPAVLESDPIENVGDITLDIDFDSDIDGHRQVALEVKEGTNRFKYLLDANKQPVIFKFHDTTDGIRHTIRGVDTEFFRLRIIVSKGVTATINASYNKTSNPYS